MRSSISKVTLRVFLFLLVSFYLPVPGHSQSNFKNGYIITNSQDTIRGLVDYREGPKAYRTVDFKPTTDAEKVTYDPTQIKGYGVPGDIFFESTVAITKYEGSPMFCEVIIEGLVSLYKVENALLVRKENGKLYELSNEANEIVIDNKRVVKYSNQYIGILNMLTADCPDLGSEVARLRMLERDIADFVEKYNACKNSSSINFKSSKPWTKLSVGIAGGVQLSKLEFQSERYEHIHLNQGSFERTDSPLAGLSLAFTSPRISERFSFVAEAFYSRSTYQQFNIVGTLTPFRNFLTIQIEQVKVPFGFRYSFPDRLFTPYIDLGASMTYHLTKYEDIIYMRDRGRTSSMKKNQIGFWGGVGVTKSITKKFKMVAELRYERTDGVAGGLLEVDKDLTSNISNYQLIFGIRYN